MLEKSKLNSIKVLISKALIDSVISHDEFDLINNALKEYKGMIKRRNQKIEDLTSLFKIVIYLLWYLFNVIVLLFEVLKKCRK